MAFAFKGKTTQQGKGSPKGFKGQRPPAPKIMPKGFAGRGAAGRNGASAQPGGPAGRPATLNSINTAEEMQAAIPTQGQSDQFDAPSPMRLAALRKMRSGGYRG
jgi:hypothetical protein